MVRAVLEDGFHWIAPSRFGYLRSTFHAGATFDNQAAMPNARIATVRAPDV